MALLKYLAAAGPKGFARRALAISAAWLLVIYPLLNYFAWDYLPTTAKAIGGDFSQYYSGALSVREGLNDCLYPQPNTAVYSNPPTFRPLINTPLFDPDADISRIGKWAFYPQMSEPEASTVSPILTEQCQELQGNSHYIYPPPLALVLAPLSLLDYTTANRAVWFTLMCASLFGIAYYSSRICRILFPNPTYIEGVAALLPAVPTWLASGLSTALYIGNVSPLIGFLVTLVAYAFLTNKQSLIALGIIPLVLFKGIGLTWCPLLLIGRPKWRAIWLMAILTLILNALTLYLGGWTLYQTFFREILPKASLPLGIGVQGLLMCILGVDAGIFATVTKLALLLTIYYYHFKAIRQGRHSGLVALVSIIATMAVFNLLNPVVWPHYFTCYLILPFSPWIIGEILLTRGKTRVLLTTLALSTVVCWFDTIFLVKQSWLVVILGKLNLYTPLVDLVRKMLSQISFYIIPNAVTILILVLAIRRLMAWNTPMAPTNGAWDSGNPTSLESGANQPAT